MSGLPSFENGKTLVTSPWAYDDGSGLPLSTIAKDGKVPMLPRTGSARSAIATLPAMASSRPAFGSGWFRRPKRTDSTIAITATKISRSPRFENGFGIGRRL